MNIYEQFSAPYIRCEEAEKSRLKFCNYGKVFEIETEVQTQTTTTTTTSTTTVGVMDWFVDGGSKKPRRTKRDVDASW